MNARVSYPLVAAPGTGHWMQDRLAEARGILADVPQHPETLIILACRVVAGQTDCANECADAVDLLRLLDRRPLHVITTAVIPNGGAA